MKFPVKHSGSSLLGRASLDPRIIKTIPSFSPKNYVAIDVESTGVDVWGQRLVMGVMVDDMPFSVSMCDEEGNGWYAEWKVDPYTRVVTPNPKDVDFITDTVRDKGAVFHNSKFDCRMLSKVGIDIVSLASSVEDTLFMARVCNTLEISYGLKYLSKRLLGIEDIDEKALQDAVKQARGKVRRINTLARKNGSKIILINDDGGEREANADYWLPGYFAHSDPDTYGAWSSLCGIYCKLDTYRTMALFRLYSKIMEEEGLIQDNDFWMRQTYELEMRKVWPIVNAMEDRGLKVYPETVVEESNKCSEAMVEHKANMVLMIQKQGLKPISDERLKPRLTPTGRVSTAKVDNSFNPGSSPQILRILYLPKSEGGLGIPKQYARKGPRKGTPESIENGTASLTADKDTLRDLMYEPFVRELVGYRGASHIKGLFFDSLLGIPKGAPSLFLPGKGRIKTDIHKSTAAHRAKEKRENLSNYYVHPGLNQCGTKTGRFSAGGDMGINPQQATAGGKKSLGGGRFSSQKVFGPRKGYVWLGFDFSQQEGRIFAELAGVEVMLRALYNDEDLFEVMANEAWGGKDNPKSSKAGIIALELFKDSPSNCPSCEGKGYVKGSEDRCSKCKGTGSAVGAYWKEIGWGPKIASRTHPDSPEVYNVVQGWLKKYNYNIIQAEAALGKEASRQRCKHITYAKIFGGGPGSYTHLLYCTLEEAVEFNDQYNDTMPEMKRYMKSLENDVKSKPYGPRGGCKGYIVNLYGRKLMVDPGWAYRAVSYMIQGSAADMMKDSLVKVHSFLKSTSLDAHIVLTIHDEIKIEVRENQVSTPLIFAIANRMEDTGGRIKVPMPVGVSICKDRWSVGETEYSLSPEGLLIPKKK